jgi:hypothetical protein
VKPKTPSEILHSIFSGKRFEPTKRVKDLYHVPRGRRHLPVEPRWVGHKYEIVGGVTWAAVIADSVLKNNALLVRLRSIPKKSVA